MRRSRGKMACGDRRVGQHPHGGEGAPLDRVTGFNHRRLLEPIGYMPPAEFETRCNAPAAVA